MRNVGIYTRISRDGTGEGLGVDRQTADCVRLAEQRDWPVADTYTDNDLSAYSGKPRPAYRRLMADVAAGAIDTIVAWHPDRLHRSVRELEEFIDVVEAAAATVVTVRAGDYDLSTPSGRLIARQLGAIARYESEHRSERVTAALLQKAQAGRSHGRRSYGWTRWSDEAKRLPLGEEVVVPGEAAVIRELAERVIAGHSLHSIVVDLNRRGVPAPHGGPWAKVKLRAVVQRPRNAGLRAYRGQVIGGGDWPPVLDGATLDRVNAILNDPGRRMVDSNKVRYLLSGIAVCGRCGQPVRPMSNRGVPSYRCAGASHVVRRRIPIDTLVGDLARARMAAPEFQDLMRVEEGDGVRAARDRVEEVRAVLDNAALAYAAGEIDRRQLRLITAKARPQLDEWEQRVAERLEPGLAAAFGPTTAGGWDDLELSTQRAFIKRFMTVTILPSSQGARGFDPDLVRVEWVR